MTCSAFRSAILMPLLLLLPFESPKVAAAERPERASPAPHIVLFLADDLGWGDVGFHGSAIPTPQIDSLAKRGVRLRTVLRATGLYTDTRRALDRALPDATRPADGRHQAMGEAWAAGHGYILHNVTPWSGALRMGRWKLLHNGNTPANATEGPGKETWELFDMDADPNEKTDLSSSKHPEVFAKLCARLQSLREEAAPANIPPNVAPAGFESPRVWGEPVSH